MWCSTLRVYCRGRRVSLSSFVVPVETVTGKKDYILVKVFEVLPGALMLLFERVSECVYVCVCVCV